MLAANQRICIPFLRPKNIRAFRQMLRIALLSAAFCLAATVPAHAQVSGQNVNMVSGTNWTNGDPFLQRQNEPSIAVSSRNSSHLLGGANDYRTVDLPGLLGIDERGDAWLGLFKSFDAGRRWQSTLLPGFPLDGSSEGLASPIHGFQAASDPTVRAGTNGLFYYTGIAYNRGTKPLSAVFIARFIDLNNKENGSATVENGSITNLAPRDSIKYIDAQIIGRGTPDIFLDKPWLAVDIPRGNSTCTVSVNQDGKTITQTVPAGPVYVTATAFVGTGANQFSTILFRRSLDCGVTWSVPVILSRNDELFGDAEHQGTMIAIDPSVPSTQPATIYVAWRRFANLNDPDDAPAIFVAKSTDGGRHWAVPVPIVLFPMTCVKNPKGTGCPYDQDFTTASFRSNGYPAMTVDRFGKVYIAWSQRDANGDGKIMMGVSPNGRYFPAGSVAPVDVGPVKDDNGTSFSNLSGRGTQLMPSLGLANDRLTLVYYDLRQDHTTGIYVPAPDPACDPMVTLPCTLGAQYFENRAFEGELAPPSPFNNPAVFSPNIGDSNPPLTIRRHTIDIMGAQADPLVGSFQVPSFKTFRVSRYEFGSVPALFPDVEQLQYNVPNLPLFVDGTAPFMGDYIDITGTPQIVSDGDGSWTFNVADTGTAVFHAAWTDNRDVIPPADGNWKNYTPPISASNLGSQPSKFDPTQTPLACAVGQTGMRNQNVYTAEISSGVILTSPQTSKPVLTPAGLPVQREFVVELRNATSAARSFLVTIPTQPSGATASFQQFSTQVAQTVKVNAFSSQSFPVFVVANAGSTVAFPSVLINAAENDGAATPLSGSILLNPDPTNPALANPDNVTVGANQISINEFYNPGLANPGLANPGLANPGVANPGLANPGLANPGLANPQVITALNPGLANPGLANPGLANPGLANPGLANQALTDVSYTITNEGNTSASYTVQFFQSGTLPAGAQFQIILSKLYFTQQAVGCQLQQVPTNVIVANVTNPAFVTNPNQLGNPGVANLGLQTPTLNLAPGDSGQITLRTNLSIPQVQSLVLPNLSPVAVSQSVNTVDVKQGIFTPPISLIVTSTSASLPVGVVNQPYNTSLTSIGGNTGPRIWTITAGSLPPGLQLNTASGAIAGTPTQTGSFAFTAQVMDTGVPQHTATRDLTITIVPPVAITTPSPALPEGGSGSPYAQTFSAAGGVPPYTWSSAGTLPPGVTLGTNGVLSGTPTAGGTYNFAIRVTDAFGLFASAPYTVVITNAVPAGAQIQFITQPTATTAGQAISPAVRVQILDATGAAVPGVTVTLGMGNTANRPILSGSLSVVTDAAGIATFSNVILDRAGSGYTLVASVSGVSSSGAVQLIPAPPSVQQGALESDTQIRFFSERRGVALSNGVGVDANAPGTYSSLAALTPGTVSAGTIVDSYYLHADPVGVGSVVQLQAGSVTFSTDVLGLIVLDPGLTASDAALGAPGTLYPPGGRALEVGNPTDTAILSADRRTVTLHLSNTGATDDVRVITAANPNASFGQITSAPFSAAAGTGFITTVAGSTWTFPSGATPTTAPLGLGADFTGLRVGVVADALGNVYVADPNNHMVFKISGGTFSIVAGTGVEGYFGDGGPATAARLDFPIAVALSPAGELYIADNNNSVIRKVNSAGTITTVVGIGFPEYFGDGGQAINAALNFPEGISFDSTGNLFIADTGNVVIRKVDTSGIITTVPMKTLPVNFPGLCAPEDVAVDLAGNLFIADSCANQVFKLDSSGNLTIAAGNGAPGYSGDGGSATSASLFTPTAITLDSAGNLYIADETNNVVRKVDTSGKITTSVGNGGFGFAGDGGPGLLASLAEPGALAFDSAGNLYIGDTNSERIRKVDTAGTITTIAGNGRFKYAGDGGTATSASLDAPGGVAVDPTGNLFTADIANLVVRKVVPAGVISTYAGTGVVAPVYVGDGGPATSASFIFPHDVKADSAGNLYLTEGGRVHKITPSGIITTLLSGGPNNTTGRLNGGLSPVAELALDSQGNVYISDTFNSRVLKLDATGAVSVVAGTGSPGFSGDGGLATLARLRQPRGVAVDNAGNLYIADQFNRRVRKVDTSGIMTTVAGNGGTTVSGDGGPATSAGLPNPWSLASDGAGNLFIGSAGVGSVRKVDASGTISTIGGGGFFGPTADGIPATNASLTNVQGLAFDAAGNLYLSDRFHDRIRKVTGVTTSPPFIFNVPSGLTVTTKGLPQGGAGAPYFQTLSAVGGAPPYAWSIASGSLPPGLNLSNSGQISGTPTTTGPFAVVVQVMDASGTTATQPLTITISGPLAVATTSLSDGVVGAAYSQTLTAMGGAGGYTWTLTSGSLPAGTTLSSAGLISGTLTTTGTYSFTVTVTDLSGQSASAPFTVNVVVSNPVPAGSHILFIIQPPGPRGGGSTGLQAVVQLFDANNAPIAGAQLSASFGAKPCPDAALSGTLTAVTDANGLAAFSGITSNRGGQGYTGVATATSNPQVFATSIPFNIQGFCPTGNLTTLRRENTVTLLPNGKVLILGGLNSNTVSAALALNTAELFDPATGVFTATGSMTAPRDLATATVLPNGKVLVVGGYDATSATLTSAELYDPATGVFTATGSMSVPRQEHTATLLPNGRVLIAGGVKWAFPTTFYASAEIYDPATGQFTLTGTMNSAHVDHTATLLSNGKVLVASGEGSTNPDASNQQITLSAELYDPSTGTFTPTGSMTIGRFNQAATTLSDGRVVITGGYADVNTRTATASAELYDPSTGTFSPTGTMNVARAEHTSTLLPNGTVLIGGGFSSAGFFSGVQLSTAEIYNPLSGNFKGLANMAFAHSRIVAPLLPNGAVLLASGTNAELFFPTDPPFQVQEFTATSNTNVTRQQHTSTLLPNGKTLIAGGTAGGGAATTSSELYDPVAGTFTATGSLNTGRIYHTATLLSNGLVLIAGGLGSSGGTLASAELYNPATGTFAATGSMNTTRWTHTATLLNNGLVLIAGGVQSATVIASAELYDPATGIFTTTGSMNSSRTEHTATLLNNGLVLIAGGFGSVPARAELYDPATGIFTSTGSLNTGRRDHTATLLNNGLVLIAGGFGLSGGALASAELYNPATGTFSAAGNLNTARYYQTATVLNNGLVLIAGGSDSNFNPLAVAELYDAATATFTATGSLNTARKLHTATLLPTGKVLVAGGQGNTGPQATSELYQSGAIQQLQPQSCSYEGHIRSINGNTPTAVRFVNTSATSTFQIFWLNYTGQRVLYATLGPGQSFIQQTFLTHPWVIADTSPAATCQEIYLPLPEQAPAVFGAPVTDAAASFEQGWITHSNPNGVWSYGYSSGFANAVTLYDQTAQPGVNGPNAQYWLSSSVNIGESPSAEFNNGPAFDDGNVNFLPNEFVLVAGIGGQYSDLVFTAPADGTYSVVSSFRGDQHGIGTLVGVVGNGNILFSSSVTAVGQIVPFSTRVSLKAGNTLVFSVGPGGGSQNTGVSATITGP